MIKTELRVIVSGLQNYSYGGLAAKEEGRDG